MIHYIHHQNIDRVKWDKLIDKAVNRNYYAYSWFLDLVCERWDGLVEDDYISVMPVTKGKKLFLDYVFQPMFAQQLGIFSVHPLSQAGIEAFLQVLASKFSYIELNLNYDNHYSYDGFSHREMHNYEISLAKPYADLRKYFSENAKRNIKKGKEHGLYIEKSAEPADTISMFQKNKGHLYPNIKSINYKTLQKLMQSLLAKNMAEVWYVKNKDGMVMAGAFFLMFEGRIIFLFSGRKEEAKDNKAMFFLFDRIIADYSGRNIVLDCAGSNDPGVARFYYSFGADLKKYQRIKRNGLPFFIKWLKK
jgi:hypothetical protein